ncbi:uncharacterized protein LOC118190251 isoform X2 [Stegodyphus dumicola]|uniref:uncharacterized protein LOC118190251 isoform X2 n=1 Tax=Stegodyphus dumicola TaxID=202533 RepID=UPI0015A98283|nr:uncharacterized protein LOC118190251 isoform X2 [Stegodyphus dumicola]
MSIVYWYLNIKGMNVPSIMWNLYLLMLMIIPPGMTADKKEILADTCSDDSVLPNTQPLAQRKTTAHSNFTHVIGFFDVHKGDKCHLLIQDGMEQVMMAIGVFENQLAILNDGVAADIGFDIYDTCSNSSTAVLHLIRALVNTQILRPDCRNEHFIGVIGPTNPEVQGKVATFLKSISIPYFPLITLSLKEEIKAVTEVLFDLKWQMVALFASTKELENEFREEADIHNICIVSSTVLTTDTKSDFFLRMTFQEITSSTTKVAIVLGMGISAQRLYEMAILTNSSIQYWFLVGVDEKESELSIIFGPDQPVILFKRSLSKIPKFDENILEAYEFGAKIKQLNLPRSYVAYVNSCSSNMNGSRFEKIRCDEHPLRMRNPQWSTVNEAIDNLLRDISKTGIFGNDSITTKLASISESSNLTSNEIEIWTFQHAIGKFSKHKELQVGHYYQGQLIWDKKRLNILRFTGSGWFKIPEFHCRHSCPEVCSNFENISITPDFESFFSRIYHWKHETWVTILLTTSSIGIIVAVSTALFLIAKACREDFEEGTQISNVMLLISVIFSYCCSAFFLFHADTPTCSKRITVVGIAYACMLAPALSRCFLLIAAEMDGIHSHISGFLQSMLCFFISTVQIAMAAYYWLSYSDVKKSISRCAIEMKQTIAYFSYVMFLSFLWLIASPFCIRSRRNNREGLLLHLGSVAVCLVWLIWYLLFFLLPPRWNEFTICFGLVATATSVLLVVFLPKIYRLIISAAAKQQGQMSMQPVIFASTSSRSPNLSIYESVNHGYNPDKDGFIVDVFRDEDDSPAPRKMTHL